MKTRGTLTNVLNSGLGGFFSYIYCAIQVLLILNAKLCFLMLCTLLLLICRVWRYGHILTPQRSWISQHLIVLLRYA